MQHSAVGSLPVAVFSLKKERKKKKKEKKKKKKMKKLPTAVCRLARDRPMSIFSFFHTCVCKEEGGLISSSLKVALINNIQCSKRAQCMPWGIGGERLKFRLKLTTVSQKFIFQRCATAAREDFHFFSPFWILWIQYTVYFSVLTIFESCVKVCWLYVFSHMSTALRWPKFGLSYSLSNSGSINN